MITTRKATLEDLPVLLEFEQEIIKAERPFDVTLKEEKISYYNIKAMILADDIEVIVVVDNDMPVSSGYASIVTPKKYFKFDKFAYLGFMYTIPSHRGRGINKIVVQTLFDWIKSKKIHEVRLDVYTENIGAIKAYEKAGFKKNLLNMRVDLRNVL
ncbi:GNAT family N-acetyltransferase [Tenacibaculum sp. E3R01]|uniref:GNAT family N-acetyltransferase n=1 Tax=Tenacibaculum sp. E3R01 TaxID=2267227 RepID=UPI000DE96B74|nr:GNAT family N-acetyltransferase [Tenacibaculum sp. E3R01]RBW55706.1 GNAT family N-acetyltransferase [Tenacibaculum sp. E3R01]